MPVGHRLAMVLQSAYFNVRESLYIVGTPILFSTHYTRKQQLPIYVYLIYVTVLYVLVHNNPPHDKLSVWISIMPLQCIVPTVTAPPCLMCIVPHNPPLICMYYIYVTLSYALVHNNSPPLKKNQVCES